MKKLLILLLFITSLVNAQDRIIKLSNEDPKQDKVGTAEYIPTLANKGQKSDVHITISDNTIDFKNITHDQYWLKFTGSYTRPINFKNNKGNIRITFDMATVKANTSSPTLKFVDCGSVDLDGLNNSKVLGSGNISGQLIDFTGKWWDVKVHGFYLDQGRNNAAGSTDGGAMVQLHGIESATFNHGNIKIYDIDGRNANDEFIYALLYYTANASRAKSLEIYHTKIKNSGRDFWQATNIDSIYIHDNIGDNGSLEQSSDHMSGFSLNDGNKYVKLENNRVTNIPQFIYSGTISGKLETLNNTYVQGTSVIIANQAIYTKTSTLLQYDSITTPKAKEAAIAQDKAQVTYQGLTVVAKKLFRYTTPIPQELPAIKTIPVQAIVEETTLGGQTTRVLIYNGVRIPIN
jgi:hypothetical protein